MTERPIIYVDRRLKWWECLSVAIRLGILPRKVRLIEKIVHESWERQKWPKVLIGGIGGIRGRYVETDKRNRYFYVYLHGKWGYKRE